MKLVEKKRALSELTIEELLERRREIQFMGSQYALNGCEPPPQLTTEWEALERELEKRPGARASLR